MILHTAAKLRIFFINTKTNLTIIFVRTFVLLETAAEAVANMCVGWNLGNTLDSNSGDVNNMWIEKWSGRTPADYEKAWGQPITKPELMAMMKKAVTER